MHILLLLFGLFLVGAVLLDSFQTIILPRRPVVRFRLTRLFFLATWIPWTRVVHMIRDHRRREQYYSFYGPLSLLMLFIVWAISLVTAFAFIYFGLHDPLTDPWHPVTAIGRLRSCFYVSGSTLFTLGLGDVIPARYAIRFLIVVEAGTGLGFHCTGDWLFAGAVLCVFCARDGGGAARCTRWVSAYCGRTPASSSLRWWRPGAE